MKAKKNETKKCTCSMEDGIHEWDCAIDLENRRKEFDRTQKIAQKLREIFKRDDIIGMTGMLDYIIRSVEEATSLVEKES